MTKKREKFVELAEKRVNRAIKDIRLIANLSNRSSYEFTEEDIRQIVKVLQNELNAMKARFSSEATEQEPVFRLKG